MSDKPKSITELAEYDAPIAPGMSVPGMPEMGSGVSRRRSVAPPKDPVRVRPPTTNKSPVVEEASFDTRTREAAPTLSVRPAVRPRVNTVLSGSPFTGTFLPSKSVLEQEGFRGFLREMVQKYDLCPK
jgi:hypothetical protein